MVRLATIGTSSITDFFLGGVKLTGRFTLSAVYSRSFETGRSFADKHGCSKVFTNLYEMAQYEGIDAVYIASPNAFHFEQSKLFLENGKNVICEKPVVTNYSQLEELLKIAKSNGVIYTEAIMPVYTPASGLIKEEIKRLGKLSLARIDFCQRSSRYDAFKRGEQVNIFDMSLAAGTLMDLGIYCVYAAVDLFGMPDKILSGADFLSNGADGSGAAIFSYSDFSVILTYSKTGQSQIGSEIVGDFGAIKIKSISQFTGVSSNINGVEKEICGTPIKEEVMKWEAAYFADYIENKEKYLCDYEEKIQLMLKAHKCMEIMRNNADIIFGGQK
ncbi:MAG: Gfo/Idh/MocA family oxidoreductase [Clostridia bacterium]|nr:Gfo/Idh/MocA family oxidoreductase [Clostridia bacterium]